MEDKIRVDNPVNDYMKNEPWHLETYTPPDSVPKYRPYSYIENQQLYDRLQRDIYQSSQKVVPKETKKFPKVLKYAIGIAIAAVAAFLLKNPVMNLISKFRRP